MTICFWYYLTGTPNNNPAANMFQMSPNNGTYQDAYNIKFQWVSTSFNFQIYAGSGSNPVPIQIDCGTGPAALNTWKFTAITISTTSGVKVYFYDLATSTLTNPVSVALSTSLWNSTYYIGKLTQTRLGTGFYNPFPGYYDNFRIYNSALTQTEIQSIIDYEK
jgi:hypothetical protein